LRRCEVSRPSICPLPQELLEALSPSGAVVTRGAPHIWPAGPVPGVYVTTSQAAIDAPLEAYEGATDGALIYAERAGNRWGGNILQGESEGDCTLLTQFSTLLTPEPVRRLSPDHA